MTGGVRVGRGNGASLKLVDKFTYLGSSVSSTEKKNTDTRLTKAWTAIDRLSIIWKSDLTDKMKRSFFQVAVVSILLYGCTMWTLTKRLQKKLDDNYTRMLRAILNKSRRQYPTRHQLCGHLPPITKTIKVRRARHAGHCWRSKDELISDVLLWTPTYGQAKAGRPVQTYIQQLMETQTRLSRHNKLIPAENIAGIFSVSSDDSFYMLCIVPEMWCDWGVTVRIQKINRKIKEIKSKIN